MIRDEKARMPIVPLAIAAHPAVRYDNPEEVESCGFIVVVII